jgi:hypothetical protein
MIEISDEKSEYCHEKANVNIDLIEAFLIANVLDDTDSKYNDAQELAHSLYDMLYRIELMKLTHENKKGKFYE